MTAIVAGHTPSAVAVWSLVATAAVLHAHASVKVSQLSVTDRRRVRESTIRTVSAILWPAILLAIVPAQDANDRRLLLPLAWSFAIGTLDMYLIHHVESTTERAVRLANRELGSGRADVRPQRPAGILRLRAPSTSPASRRPS